MQRTILSALCLLLVTSGCAGVPLPYTDYRLGDWRIESSRKERNSGCTNLEALNIVAGALEAQHLAYIRSRDDEDAIVASEILGSLSERCRARIRKLDVAQIKHELFGNVQIVGDASKLRELGGIAFVYTDTHTESGIELSLHVRSHKRGPKRRLVAIYRLEDDKVIHFNYSGTNNVDTKSRVWPIREFLGLAKVGVGIIVP